MVKNRKSCDVPDATINRLPLYLEKLKLLQAIGVEDVSSRQLAESLDIKASQLRHDFHYFGGFSRPGRPYQVEKLVPALEQIIGIAEPVPTAIVGAGHLGQALANYQNLDVQGFPVRGLFDTNPKLVGMVMRGQPVHDMDDLEKVIGQEKIRIAILTVPAVQRPGGGHPAGGRGRHRYLQLRPDRSEGSRGRGRAQRTAGRRHHVAELQGEMHPAGSGRKSSPRSSRHQRTRFAPQVKPDPKATVTSRSPLSGDLL